MSLPLLFLPGMMCDARLFTAQIAHLSRERAVCVAPITAHDTVAALAAEVLTHAPPKFALAGLSMGGIVAMEMIRQAPERISHLALMDTNPKAETREVAAGREPQIEAVERGQLACVMRDEMKPNYLADGPQTGPILDLCMEMAIALGPFVFKRQSRALQSRPDQCETLKSVQVPRLILMGERDTLCPRARHDLMHELIPGSRLAVIPGAGHLPTLEQPELTNAALSNWLAG